MKLLLLSFFLISCNTLKRSASIRLTTSNTIYLQNAIDESSVDNAILQLHNKARKDSQIYLVINSPGGSIFAGDRLISYLHNFPNVSIICLDCASMAYMIFQLHKSERIITHNSVLMSHRASTGGLEGQLNDGELESRLAFLKRVIQGMEESIAKRLDLEIEEYKNLIRDEWYIYGSDALFNENADILADLTCSTKLINTPMLKIEFTQQGIYMNAYSSCPLIKNPVESKLILQF